MKLSAKLAIIVVAMLAIVLIVFGFARMITSKGDIDIKYSDKETQVKFDWCIPGNPFNDFPDTRVIQARVTNDEEWCYVRNLEEGTVEIYNSLETKVKP